MGTAEILIEYQKKRDREILAAKKREELIYKAHPNLAKIDKEIASTAIQNITSGGSRKELKEKLEKLELEKKEILKKANINEEELQPKFECKKCEDTGYVKDKLCSCVKQKLFDEEYNKTNIFNLENSTFDKFKFTVYSNDVDKNYKKSPRKNAEEIVEKAKEFIENFDDSDTKNLLFTGNTGLGKSFLSACIANEIIKKGKTVLYQTAPNMFDKIIDYRFGKGDTSYDYIKHLLDVDLLIIDDLGSEQPNNMKMSELFNIINSRILNSENKIKKTIISSNLSLENIMQNYDERIFSRIIGNYDILLFFGDDIRLKK